MGRSLATSLTAHLTCLEGAFVWLFLARPNILEDGMSHEGCLFFARRLEGKILKCSYLSSTWD